MKKLPLFICLAILTLPQISLAGSATWLASPPTNSWTNATNWSAGGPPNGSGDTAIFALSSTTAISQSANIQVSGISFSGGGNPFALTTEPPFTLTISGAGIMNNSGLIQSFYVAAATNSAAINFINAATAGNLTTFTNSGSPNANLEGAITSFADNSSAGAGTFTNNPGTTASADGGVTQFLDNATAGNSTIINNGAVVSNASGGNTRFFGVSTLGNANVTNNAAAPGFQLDAMASGRTLFFETSTAAEGTVINNGGGSITGRTEFYDNATAGNATFTNNPGSQGGIFSRVVGGFVIFDDNATANTGTFTNQGGTQDHPGGGITTFDGNSTAANGIFINNSATDPQADYGGATYFYGNSSAGSATLIANSGFVQDLGGFIEFDEFSAGGTARLEIFGTGWLDISPHGVPGVTVGSVEGDGNIFLGANQLTVGNNNTSTTFSGSIRDGAPAGANASSMGRVKKIGTGTFTLDLANSYSGGTFLNGGTLRARHDGALGAGNVLLAPGTTLILQTGTTNNYISDTASLSIDTGSTVNLNFTGTPDVVGFLLVDGVTQPAGLYGSATSGAPNQLPQFTGAGKILVTTPAARSRKQHGSGGYAHITLPFTGPVGIECRNAGANNSYTIIATFGFPVTFANASVTSGTGMIASTTGNGTDFITLNLTGVTNVQRLAITLSGVNYGAATGNVVIRMGVLIGDTTTNGSVNASDVSQTKSRSGQPVDGSNFRDDVTLSNSINSSDVSIVKSKSGTALP